MGHRQLRGSADPLGHEAPYGDVGFAIVSGTPGTIRHPAPGQSFELDDDNDAERVEAIAVALAQELRVVEQRLRAFRTRREVRDYLMVNRDRKDRRDFVIPANLELKLFTAASLAVIDGDPAACDLVVETEAEMASRRDRLSVARLARIVR